MTWEIAVGFFTIFSAFTAVMKIVLKVNKTLNSLEGAVSRLNESIARQTRKNEKIFTQLDEHTERIYRLEEKKTTRERKKKNEDRLEAEALQP